MSSRIAVCGQHPVSTATIRSVGSTAARRSASASSVVKMSFVTTATDNSSRSSTQSAPTSVVLPLPTGPPTPMRTARVATATRRWSMWVLVVVVVAVAHREPPCQATKSRAVQRPWSSPRMSVSAPPSAGSSAGAVVAQSAAAGDELGDERPRRRLDRRDVDRVEAQQAHPCARHRGGEVVHRDRRGVGGIAAGDGDQHPQHDRLLAPVEPVEPRIGPHPAPDPQQLATHPGTDLAQPRRQDARGELGVEHNRFGAARRRGCGEGGVRDAGRRQRPWRYRASVASSVTSPQATAASTPAEWACPPAGNRPSASSSRSVPIGVFRAGGPLTKHSAATKHSDERSNGAIRRGSSAGPSGARPPATPR